MSLLSNDSKQNLPLIIRLSQEAYPDSNVLAALTATQAILEGGLLNSPPSNLALNYCNLFGIKAKVAEDGTILTRGTKGVIYLMTTECNSKGCYKIKQPFLYNSGIEDSLKQHKELLQKPRYAEVLKAKTLADAALKIKQAGYATDPKYTQKLIETYNKYVSKYITA